jgi:hypothetical protein
MPGFCFFCFSISSADVFPALLRNGGRRMLSDRADKLQKQFSLLEDAFSKNHIRKSSNAAPRGLPLFDEQKKTRLPSHLSAKRKRVVGKSIFGPIKRKQFMNLF